MDSLGSSEVSSNLITLLFRFSIILFVLISFVMSPYRGDVKIREATSEVVVVKATYDRPRGVLTRRSWDREQVMLYLRDENNQRFRFGVTRDDANYLDRGEKFLSLRPGEKLLVKSIESNYRKRTLIFLKSKNFFIQNDEQSLRRDMLLISESDRSQGALLLKLSFLIIFVELMRSLITYLWRQTKK